MSMNVEGRARARADDSESDPGPPRASGSALTASYMPSGHSRRPTLLRPLATVAMVAAAAAAAAAALPTLSPDAASCAAAAASLVCDGRTDDTKALQSALLNCAAAKMPLALPASRTCISFPLVLP
eukprot:COSAG06_NODE_19327_length_843_cov_2.045699_1_plen_125_part_10